MTVYHFAILAVFAIPLILWARNASSSLKTVQKTPPEQDLTNYAFALRITALICGYLAMFGLVSDRFGIAVGQTLGSIIATTVLFLTIWGGTHMVGRRFIVPRRKAFELALFVFALFIVFVFIQLRVAQIAR